MTNPFDQLAASVMPYFHHYMGEQGSLTLVDRSGDVTPPYDAILGDVREEVIPANGQEFQEDVLVERRSVRLVTIADIDLYSGVRIGADTNPWMIDQASDVSSFQMTLQLVRETRLRHRRHGMTQEVK